MRQYIVIVTKLWGKRISGPAVAISGLILAIVQQIVHDPPGAALALRISTWASLAIALGLVLVAQYDAWCLERIRYEEERLRYEAEVAKNLRPDIHGEASNFRLSGIYGSSASAPGSPRTVSGRFSCDLYLCNRSLRDTNFQGVEFDGSALTPPVIFSRKRAPDETGFVAPLPDACLLQNAIGVNIPRVPFQVDVEYPQGYPAIDLTNLKVWVFDGLLARHQVSVRSGEALTWRQGHS